jgi:hypothetical protein
MTLLRLGRATQTLALPQMLPTAHSLSFLQASPTLAARASAAAATIRPTATATRATVWRIQPARATTG